MGLETGSFLNDLDITNPLNIDPKAQGDDHLRLIKTVLKATFPNFAGVFNRVRRLSTSVTITKTDTATVFLSDAVVTITLPALNSVGAGFFLTFFAANNVINFQTVNSELLNGTAALRVIPASQVGFLFWTATEWILVAGAGQNINSDITRLTQLALLDAPTVALDPLADLLYILDASNGSRVSLATLPAQIPAGMILPFAAGYAPTGFLSVPGGPTTLNRSTYAVLFAAIGTTWGGGDGSSTFNMPWIPADTAILNNGGAIGSYSSGAIKSHSHTSYWTQVVGGSQPGYTGGSNYGNSFTATTSSVGSSENYPAGQRMNYCVKY